MSPSGLETGGVRQRSVEERGHATWPEKPEPGRHRALETSSVEVLQSADMG